MCAIFVFPVTIIDSCTLENLLICRSLFIGARAQTGSILVKLTELKAAVDALHEKESHLRNIEKQLNNIKQQAARYITGLYAKLGMGSIL